MIDRSPGVVGIMYPAILHGDRSYRAAAVGRVREAFPDVDVLDVEYMEPSELRTRRSVADFERQDGDVTPLTEEQAEVLARSEALLTLDLPFDIGDHAPVLRWVQATGTGIGQLRSAGLAEAGIRLTNASGTSSDEIAEFVIARVLQHLKRLPEIDSNQAERRWQPVYGEPVAGRTIGLVGFGAIGRRVAELAAAFGMRVLACRRDPAIRTGVAEHVYPVEQLLEMAAECDVVVASLPETAETRGLIDRSVFEAMPANGFFCNVGRGSSVVEPDLVGALDSGRLAGASSDVFSEEPLPADSPLWAVPGLHVSPHCSSVPAVSIERVVDLFCENLRRLRTGEPLLNEVDLHLGY